MELPEHLLYAKTHEWVETNNSTEFTVGITDHAQDLLGDLVFVSLPELGQPFEQGQACMFVESVKSASDIHMPISGTVSAVNDALVDEPEKVNQDAYGEGWLFKFRADATSDISNLLESSAYEASLDE